MACDLGKHECLERTFIVMELLSYVSEHPQVKANPEWSALAQKARDDLHALYKAIGAADDRPSSLAPLEEQTPNPLDSLSLRLRSALKHEWASRLELKREHGDILNWICSLPPHKLLWIPGVGRTYLAELRSWAKANGRSLADKR